MYALKNKVQLIGNLGQNPEIKTLDGGKKLAKFSIATNEAYRNADGEKITETQWHNLVAFGKLAEIIEKYITFRSSRGRKTHLPDLQRQRRE
jgi:single-strand DNA-binding protein